MEFKPNNVQNKSSYIINSALDTYNKISNANCLFDGQEGTDFRNGSAFYFDIGSYIDITLNEDGNIWCHSNSLCAEHNAHYLNVFLYDNNSWEDVTSTIVQNGREINGIWSKVFPKLKKGRYKFTLGTRYLNNTIGNYRIDDEWYIKSLHTTKYLIQDKSNILYTLKSNSINEYTDNIIPIMTSDTSPNGVASASGVWSSATSAFYAFDKNISTDWHMENAHYKVPQWIKYKFEKANIIGKYKIIFRDASYVSQDWIFQGSNDNINWFDLDKRQVINPTLNEITYEFQNNNSYLYYRFLFQKLGTSGWLAVKEIGMMEKKSENLNVLGNNLTEDLFKNKGFHNPSIIQNQQINQKETYGINKGSLGTGKLFEISLSNDIKAIQNME